MWNMWVDFVEGVEEVHQAGCIGILQIGLRDLGLTQREADQRSCLRRRSSGVPSLLSEAISGLPFEDV
jgi:hypothetical protein